MTEPATGNPASSDLPALQAIVSALSEVAAVTDTSGRLLFCNEHWKEAFAQNADSDQGEMQFWASSVRFAINDAGREKLLEAFAKIAAAKITHYEDKFEIHDSAGWAWYSVRLAVVQLPSQRVVLVRFEKIGPSLLPFQTIEAPLSLYNALLDDLPLLLNICDGDRRYVWANRFFQKRFGLTASEIVGRPVGAIPGLSEFERLQELREACYSTGLEQGDIVSLQLKGRKIVLDMRFIPVLDEDGQVAYVIGASRDITKQRNAETTRSAVQELLNDVLERMPIGFVATDKNFCILRANGAACTLFGYPSADLIGQHINMLMPAEYRERHHGQMNAFAKSGECNLRMEDRREVYGLKADGTVFPMMVSVLKMNLGDFPLYCVMIVDLTQIRAAEQRLVESELRIQQIQKQEALGQLAGNIAHDFNNLMAIVLGYADMISEISGISAEIRAMMAEIKKAIQRGSGLTKQILAYAKHQQLDVRPVNLHAMLREHQTMLESALTALVKLELQLDADRSSVLADENLLVQVMLNLAVNARDAMPLGGTLTISTQTVKLSEDYFTDRRIKPEPGDYVAIKVKDTGVGIPAEVIERIFDPYFSTKPRDKGTGLGLSVVYGIVKQHKGFIFCTSVPGAGTTFEILWPLCETGIEKTAQSAPVRDPVVYRSLYANLTVLVVDDEDALRTLLVRTLSSAGMQVHSAANGRLALEFIDSFSGKIDIIISDIMMPEMNGLDMANEACLLQPEAAFIFISGYSKELLASRAPGANYRLLIKPFATEALFAEINSILRASRPDLMKHYPSWEI
jgi:hypothetical protein